MGDNELHRQPGRRPELWPVRSGRERVKRGEGHRKRREIGRPGNRGRVSGKTTTAAVEHGRSGVSEVIGCSCEEPAATILACSEHRVESQRELASRPARRAPGSPARSLPYARIVRSGASQIAQPRNAGSNGAKTAGRGGSAGARVTHNALMTTRSASAGNGIRRTDPADPVERHRRPRFTRACGRPRVRGASAQANRRIRRTRRRRSARPPRETVADVLDGLCCTANTWSARKAAGADRPTGWTSC